MTFPKKMTTEELLIFEFVISDEDPNVAACRRQPKSKRLLCQQCGLWVSNRITGGKVLRCDACVAGTRQSRSSAEPFKIFRCCGNDQCPVWNQVTRLFKDAGLDSTPSYIHGHLIEIKFPTEWSKAKRLAFHVALNPHCEFRRASRKVVCSIVAKATAK